MRLGIIGGTAMPKLVSDAINSERIDLLSVDTKWGSVPMTCIKQPDGNEIFIIQRHHGDNDGFTSPHLIEHRANIDALSGAGADLILAICSVGTIPQDFPPGSIGYATQFIDLTGIAVTFSNRQAEFTSMTNPFDEKMNSILDRVLGDLQPNMHLARTYWLTQGPQFETIAEINAIEKLGGDVVGMTMPRECKLAAEREIPYSALLIASNWAAGRDPDDSSKDLDHHEVSATAAKYLDSVVDCIVAILAYPFKVG